MTVVCLNNKLYGMTGGQSSPTTVVGETTSTNPYGNFEADFDLCEMAKTAGASYVARWTTAHPSRAMKSIAKGIENKGASFVEIMSQCPTHFKQSPTEMMREYIEKSVPLGKSDEYEPGKITTGEFQDVQRPDWMSCYQELVQDIKQKNIQA